MKTGIMLLCLLAAFVSCSDLGIELPDLSGSWYLDFVTPVLTSFSKSTITFSDDGAFERVTTTHFMSGHLLGYAYVGTGRFRVGSSNQLVIIVDRAITIQGRNVREKPVPFPINPEIETITFSISENLLKLQYPPCPPNANCIDELIYKRM